MHVGSSAVGFVALRFPFVTDRFVWLHVPKTGGTWLYRILTTLPPESWRPAFGPPAHICLREVEPLLDESNRMRVPILAHVRNPWDWYVSLYFFMEQHYRNGTGGFLLPPENWSPECRVWGSTYTRGNHVQGFREALPVLLAKLHDEKCEALVPPQVSFLRTVSGQCRARAVRFEGLRENVVAAIEETGAEMSPEMRSRILVGSKENASEHPSYEHCYTPELRDLVAKYESWLIETMDYGFGERG